MTAGGKADSPPSLDASGVTIGAALAAGLRALPIAAARLLRLVVAAAVPVLLTRSPGLLRLTLPLLALPLLTLSLLTLLRLALPLLILRLALPSGTFVRTIVLLLARPDCLPGVSV